MKIIVLGAGLVGAPMAVDLDDDPAFDVSVADINSDTLNRVNKDHQIGKIRIDLSDSTNVKDLIKNYDMVVSAVPGFMGFETLKSVIDPATKRLLKRYLTMGTMAKRSL